MMARMLASPVYLEGQSGQIQIMGHRVAAHRAAEHQQNGGQNGGLHHGEGHPEHNLPLWSVQDGGCLLQIRVHIPENAADEDIGEGGVVETQHHHAGEQPQAPPGGHLNTERGSQKTVGSSRHSIGIEHVLPHHGQGPLGHDVGENENGAQILPPGQIGPGDQEGEQTAEQNGHHTGAHRQQDGVPQGLPQVGPGQAAGKQVDVVHQGIAGNLSGEVGVDGARVDFEGILHDGHNGGHCGDRKDKAHQNQDHVVGLGEKGLDLIAPHNRCAYLEGG